MRLRHLAAAAIVAGLSALPATALAQTADDPYTKAPPGDVLSEELQRAPEAQPDPEAQPASIARADPATLPVTGTDAITLTIIGLSAIAGGTVLVRRNRVHQVETTA